MGGLPDLQTTDQVRRDETEHVDLVVDVDHVGDLRTDGERLAGHDLKATEAAVESAR